MSPTNFSTSIAAAVPQHPAVVEVEPAVVPVDLAVPLGLLVNELVTDAYKYAYAAGEDGEVRVAGKHAADGRYPLEVSDMGRVCQATSISAASRPASGCASSPA